MLNRPPTLVASGLLALALLGCVTRFDPDTMQLRAEGEPLVVYATHSVGQTFVAARPRLSAVEIDWKGAGPVVLHLRDDPTSTIDLAHAEIVAPARWQFSPIPPPENRQFYLLIEAPHATADQPLHVRAVAHDVYTPGSAYVDGSPWHGDLAFRTFYDYDLAMFWNDLTHSLSDFWLVLPILALLWAPGFVLLQFWRDARHRFDDWGQVALSLGLSLTFLPFVLLWVTQLGGALSATVARVLFGGLGVLAVIMAVVRLRRMHWRKQARAFLPIALILGVGVIARLVAIRDLALPAWVDSVHHVLVARIIAETGRIPTSYEPYLAVREATYHYGFQASVAAFAWLSGKPLPQAMLILGQVLNAAMALQVYLLARWLTRRWWAAVLAAWIVALLATMPAYYVSWGRYTQLSGLLILPVALILSVESAKRRDWHAGALSVFLLAGLILTHYRVFAFYVCFIAAWWLVELAKRPHAWRARLQEVGWFAVLSLLATVLLMPWIIGVAIELWLRAFTQWSGAPSAAYWDFAWEYVTAGFDRYLLTLGALGAIVALLDRRWFSGVLLVWMGALFVITNPALFGLPGEGLINNVSMLIVWFMPLAIGCGFLSDKLISSWLMWLRGRWRTLGYAVAATILLILSAAGVQRQITIVNPLCVLAVEADREALDWIEANTPLRSRFLINAQVWEDPLYMGTDGGYWITPLAGRATTVPPALYGLGDSEQMHHVKDLARQIETLSADPDALWMLLREEGVEYVYVGALSGPLHLEMLRGAPGFRARYTNGRAFVFEVVER